MKRYLYEIFTLLGKDKRRIPGIVILFLLLSFLDVLGIAIIGPYIAMIEDASYSSKVILKVNEIIPKLLNSDNVLPFVGFSIVTLFLFKAIIGVLVNFVIARFSVDQQTRLRTELMHKYQSLPYNNYLKRNSSDYINSIQIRVNHYSKGVVLNSLKMMSDGLVALMVISFLIYTNFKSVALLCAIIIPALYIYDLSFKKKMSRLGKSSNKVVSMIIQGINEGIGGLKEIRILGVEDYFYNKVKINSLKYAKYHLISSVISLIPRYLIELLVVLSVVIMVTFFLYFGENVGSYIPTLAVFGIAAMRLVPTLSVFSKGLITLRFQRNSIARLYSDISSKDELMPSQIKSEISDVFQSLSVKKASFNYNKSSKISALNNISLEINSGQAIGFIGASGSGKTSLVDLILGLLKPQTGHILYNGKPIEKSLSNWRGQVAYIPQDTFLIDDSLRRNVALGVDDINIDNDKVIQSLKSARLYDFVLTMSKGLDTIIGERGIRLSGGQKQRVSLARAFYHDREVLIFDEATSALDENIESEIVSEIQQLKGKKTMIVIAHRLSTVAHCDIIYRLHDGKISEQGSPQEII